MEDKPRQNAGKNHQHDPNKKERDDVFFQSVQQAICLGYASSYAIHDISFAW
jgi:hypothetical protein